MHGTDIRKAIPTMTDDPHAGCRPSIVMQDELGDDDHAQGQTEEHGDVR